MASYEYIWLGLIKGLFWKYDGDGWMDGWMEGCVGCGTIRRAAPPLLSLVCPVNILLLLLLNY